MITKKCTIIEKSNPHVYSHIGRSQEVSTAVQSLGYSIRLLTQYNIEKIAQKS